MTNDESRRDEREPIEEDAEAAEQQLAPDEAPAEPADATEPADEAEAADEAEEAELAEPEAAEVPAPARGPAPTPSRAAPPPKGRDVGYRGSLPPRDDRLARRWVIAVIGIFVLILVLAVAGLPSRLIPEATPAPIPSFSLEPLPSGSVLASPQ